MKLDIGRRCESGHVETDLVEPFLVSELTNQDRAHSRRSDVGRDQLLRAGAVTIEPRVRQARVDGRLLELTAMEFDLLAYLVQRPGQVFSRDQLLRAVWHSTAAWQQPATVTEHIRRLRTKIETDPHRPRTLRTVRGAGYSLNNPESAHRSHDEASPSTELAPGTVVHLDGRIVRADHNAAAMLELSAPIELVGRQISELVSPATRAAAIEYLSCDCPGVERRTRLIDLARVGAPDLTVEVTSTSSDWNGASAQQVTFTPVSDLSAQLRRVVTGVFDEMTDAVVITDLHFHVRSWNEAAEHLYGWKQHEVSGRHILDVIHCVSDDTTDADVWDALERTDRWMADGRHVTRDGTVIDVTASATLIRGDSGEPVAIVYVTHPSSASIR